MKSIQKLLFGIAIMLFGISTIVGGIGINGYREIALVGWGISVIGVGVAASGFWSKKDDQKE